jgi:hypothetical protein
MSHGRRPHNKRVPRSLIDEPSSRYLITATELRPPPPLPLPYRLVIFKPLSGFRLTAPNRDIRLCRAAVTTTIFICAATETV